MRRIDYAVEPCLQIVSVRGKVLVGRGISGPQFEALSWPGDELGAVLRRLELKPRAPAALIHSLAQKNLLRGKSIRSKGGLNEISLISAREAQARWKTLRRKTLVCGDQLGEKLAARLGTRYVPWREASREKPSGVSVIFQAENLGKTWPSNAKSTRSSLRSLRSAARGKSYILFAMSRCSFATIQVISRLASELDAFLLLVNCSPSGGLLIGPMLGPGLTQSFEHSVLDGEKISNPDLLAFFQRGDSGKSPEVRTFTRSALRIKQALTTPTMPLLWGRLDVLPHAERFDRTRNVALVRQSSTSAKFSIERYLRSNLGNFRDLVAKVRSQLQNESLVSIRDAFDPTFSELVYSALDRTSNWKLHVMSRAKANYSHHNLYDPSEYPVELLTLSLIFSNSHTRRWAQSLSGLNCAGATTTSASLYKPGEYTSPHTDWAFNRTLGYIWSLSKDWDESWGGGFFWIPGRQMVMPEFNALHLFIVSPTSYHVVPPVTPQATGKRLTINGWWSSRRSRRARRDFLPSDPLALASGILAYTKKG